MPRPRYRHASAAVGDVRGGRALCVFGGRDAFDGLIAEVDCYDPSTNAWTTPSSLPDGRASSDQAAFAHPGATGVVYLAGGYDASYLALDIVTVADMSSGWTTTTTGGAGATTYADGPALRWKRGDVDAAVAGGYAYVSGGFTHEDDYAAPRNSVERLRLTTLANASATVGAEAGGGEGWTDVDALNQERGDKQLAGLHGRIYALGGETKVDVSGVPESELPDLGARSEVLDTVEVYDPLEDVREWRGLASMPSQLFRFGASEWRVGGGGGGGDDDDDGGYIFVFGGQVAYDGDCECFRTTDRVLAFDVHRAEQHGAEGAAASSTSSASTSAGTKTIVGVARAFCAAAVGASLWLAL